MFSFSVYGNLQLFIKKKRKPDFFFFFLAIKNILHVQVETNQSNQLHTHTPYPHILHLKTSLIISTQMNKKKKITREKISPSIIDDPYKNKLSCIM